MRRLALLFAVPVLFLATGCGDSGGGGGGGGGGSPTGPTCLFTADSCFVASGATFTAPDLATFQASCVGSGGSFVASGTCVTSGTVTGYCQIPDTSLTGVTVPGATMRGYYYTPAYDAVTADGDCTFAGGTWTGGAATVCGDGSVTGAEVCDGANLNGQTCASRGFTGGTLSCNAGCLSFNTSACTGSSFNPTNVTESESNGTIGTADGPYSTDHLISGAISPAGDFDYFAIQNATGASVTVRLETSIGGVGLCNSAYDTTITVVTSGGSQVAFNDDSGVNWCSLLSVPIPAGTTYYVFVEEWSGTSTIPSYQLQVDFP